MSRAGLTGINQSEICRVTSATAGQQCWRLPVQTRGLGFGRVRAFFAGASIALNTTAAPPRLGGSHLWAGRLGGGDCRIQNFAVCGDRGCNPVDHPLTDFADPLPRASFVSRVRHVPMMLRSVTNGETEGAP